MWYDSRMDFTAADDTASIWIAAVQGESFADFRLSVDDLSLRKR